MSPWAGQYWVWWISCPAIGWLSESSIDPVELRQLELAGHTETPAGYSGSLDDVA